MRMLRDEFPDVTVEACAGGGGRVDNAVLAVADVVWPSDETGPRDRLTIQHGFLSAYPPHAMSSWVTDEPDRIDTEPASLEFRFVVAMAGVLGIGADLLAWSPALRARARELVALYREIRPVLHAGEVTRHGVPGDPAYAVQYTTDDRVVLLAWRRPGAGPLRVPVADGVVEVPFRLAPDCDVVVLDRVPDA
jgi:alpha-galactosidase